MQSDLYPLEPVDSARGIYKTFKKHWKAQVKANTHQREKINLAWAFINAFGGPFIAAGALKLIYDSLNFVNPLLLNKLVKFLNSDEPLIVGINYVIILFFANLVMSLCLRQYFFWCYRVGMRLRSAVITSVYAKALVLSSTALLKRSLGEVTNLMSVDSNRLQTLTPYLHAIWYSFFQIGLAMYFLWGQLGRSTMVSIYLSPQFHSKGFVFNHHELFILQCLVTRLG